MSLLLALLTFVLVIVSLFLVLVILMQRAKSDGGVGAALGGGMAESAFGGETANVLTKATQTAVVIFFVLAFGLYLGRLYQHRAAVADPELQLPSSPDLLPSTPVEQSGTEPTFDIAPQPSIETPPPADAALGTPAPAQPEAPMTPAPADTTPQETPAAETAPANR